MVPFGERLGSTSRASGQAGPFSTNTNPTFDIAPTNTKQFYQGLLNPVSEPLFAYFIDRSRASSSEWVFHLLVAAIEERDVKTGEIRVLPARGNGADEFLQKANLWTENESPKVISSATPPKALGPPIKADAKAIIDANTAGLGVKDAGHGLIQLTSRSSGFQLCFYDGQANGYIPVSVTQNSVTKGPTGEPVQSQDRQQGPNSSNANPCSPGGPYTTTMRYSLRLRSVEQIFNYLGNLVDSNDKSLVRSSDPHAGCPRIPFFIYSKPVDATRFSVRYRGKSYYIASTDYINSCGKGVVDSTLPILAILNDLLNLNRDANEIPTTKAVQAVGGG
jgi:hypothetical protein